MSDTASKIVSRIHQYQWPSLDKQHLVYEDVAPVIDSLTTHSRISQAIIGKSFNGVPIHRLTLGNGPLTVLAWTQMHGDEPSASAAVLDLLAMLSDSGCDDLVGESWLSHITLHVIPMLNPDGATQRTRENAQGIDINRDAQALQTPEGRVLHQQVSELCPDIGFNLHDQSPYYAAGSSKKPATLSFLAPPFNIAGDVDATRLRAKQLIAAMHHAVGPCRPGQFGRYDDTYAHRCFGDTIAARGVSTILIESGADYNDPHRQTARSLNTLALLTAMNACITKDYQRFSLDDYYTIAENKEDGLCDVLLKNVIQVSHSGEKYQCDIAVNSSAHDHARIVATGDLSELGSFNAIDCEGLTLCKPKGFIVGHDNTITCEKYRTLLSQGYNHLICRHDNAEIETDFPAFIRTSPLPGHVGPLPGHPAFLVLRNEKGPCCALLSTQWLTF